MHLVLIIGRRVGEPIEPPLGFRVPVSGHHGRNITRGEWLDQNHLVAQGRQIAPRLTTEHPLKVTAHRSDDMLVVEDTSYRAYPDAMCVFVR